jgi:hypothetical protein
MKLKVIVEVILGKLIDSYIVGLEAQLEHSELD